MGESSNPAISSTKQAFFSLSGRIFPTAAEVGETCLKEVAAGKECGMSIAGYNDIKEGDFIEAFKIVEIKRTL